MVVWVKGAAVDMPVNQRAKIALIKEYNADKPCIFVTLLGTGKSFLIKVSDICGIELCNNQKLGLAIMFKFSGYVLTKRTK